MHTYTLAGELLHVFPLSSFARTSEFPAVRIHHRHEFLNPTRHWMIGVLGYRVSKCGDPSPRVAIISLRLCMCVCMYISAAVDATLSIAVEIC